MSSGPTQDPLGNNRPHRGQVRDDDFQVVHQGEGLSDRDTAELFLHEETEGAETEREYHPAKSPSIWSLPLPEWDHRLKMKQSALRPENCANLVDIKRLGSDTVLDPARLASLSDERLVLHGAITFFAPRLSISKMVPRDVGIELRGKIGGLYAQSVRPAFAPEGRLHEPWKKYLSELNKTLRSVTEQFFETLTSNPNWTVTECAKETANHIGQNLFTRITTGRWSNELFDRIGEHLIRAATDVDLELRARAESDSPEVSRSKAATVTALRMQNLARYDIGLTFFTKHFGKQLIGFAKEQRFDEFVPQQSVRGRGPHPESMLVWYEAAHGAGVDEMRPDLQERWKSGELGLQVVGEIPRPEELLRYSAKQLRGLLLKPRDLEPKDREAYRLLTEQEVNRIARRVAETVTTVAVPQNLVVDRMAVKVKPHDIAQKFNNISVFYLFSDVEVQLQENRRRFEQRSGEAEKNLVHYPDELLNDTRESCIRFMQMLLDPEKYLATDRNIRLDILKSLGPMRKDDPTVVASLVQNYSEEEGRTFELHIREPKLLLESFRNVNLNPNAKSKEDLFRNPNATGEHDRFTNGQDVSPYYHHLDKLSDRYKLVFVSPVDHEPYVEYVKRHHEKGFGPPLPGRERVENMMRIDPEFKEIFQFLETRGMGPDRSLTESHYPMD